MMTTEEKGILSSAGWSASKSDESRHAALTKAVKLHGVEKVVDDLKWVEKKWAGDPIAKKCRSDIEWLFRLHLKDEQKAEHKTFLCRKCKFNAAYDFIRCPRCTEPKKDS